MNKKENESEINSKKLTKLLLAIFKGVTQKISVSLVLNAKRQVDETIARIKRGIIAGFFLISGAFFLLIGLAVYLESVCSFIPGGGYLVVGGSSVLIAALISVIKK